MTKTLAYVFGAVFIILGLLGFVNDPILGIFDVDTLHNLIHLASGILLIVFAGQGELPAKKFFLVLGIVYALVTVLGFFTAEGDKLLGLIAANNNDDYLHLVLAIVFLAIGLKKSSDTPAVNMPNM